MNLATVDICSQVGETVDELTWLKLQAEGAWRHGTEWTLTAEQTPEGFFIHRLLALPFSFASGRGGLDGAEPKATPLPRTGLLLEDHEREPKQPRDFTGPEDAIQWGLGQGVFWDEDHARTAYAFIKAERQPKTAAQMWRAWVAYVEERVEHTYVKEGV